jgi:hypothetical protein
MENKWAVVLREKERVELEAIVVDENKEAALNFLKKVILAQVVASEQGKLKNPGFSKDAIAAFKQKQG